MMATAICEQDLTRLSIFYSPSSLESKTRMMKTPPYGAKIGRLPLPFQEQVHLEDLFPWWISGVSYSGAFDQAHRCLSAMWVPRSPEPLYKAFHSSWSSLILTASWKI